MFRFVHAADLHLDSPFTGIRNTHRDVGEILRQATFAAYDNLITLCINREVGALLIAGDVFDGADHSLVGQIKFMKGLERLYAHGIRTFICHGNHDPLDSWDAGLRTPDNVHRFGSEPACVPVYPDSATSPIVCGVSYPTREVRETLLGGFPSRDSTRFTIGLLHANAGGDSVHASYAPCTIEDLTAVGYDYWALGHVHTRDIKYEGNPWVVYSGNTQGRHPNETGARGVYVVDVDDEHRIEMEFVPVDSVRWEQRNLDIHDINTPSDLEERLHQIVDGLRVEVEGRSFVYRIRLHGRGQLHTSLAKPDNIDAMTTQLNDTWQEQRPFAWCSEIRDDTRSEIDRDQLRKGTDFIGDFLKLTEEMSQDQNLQNILKQELAPLFENRSAKRHLDDILRTEADAKALMEAAEDAALDLLVTEDHDAGQV